MAAEPMPAAAPIHALRPADLRAAVIRLPFAGSGAGAAAGCSGAAGVSSCVLMPAAMPERG